MDTDSFVLSVKTKFVIEYSKTLGEFFDFSILNENHVLFGNESKKKLENLKQKLLKKTGLMSLFV